MDQWYEHNRQLFDEEVRFMTATMPTAKCGFCKMEICTGLLKSTQSFAE